MIPNELMGKKVNVSKAVNLNIVIITGSSLRHDRFSYRIQQEFKDNHIVWYQINDNYAKEEEKLKIKLKKIITKLKLEFHKLSLIEKNKIIFSLKLLNWLFRFLRNYYYGIKVSKEINKSENKILKKELINLKSEIKLTPKIISSKYIYEPNFQKEIDKLNPYFLLVLGGPLIPNKILNSVKGFCINQHAGHSPDYKGSSTSDWALFHRDLSKISSTVHLMNSGADTGPILRRSKPSLNVNDNISDVFIRVVVLGTELLIETVRDIINLDYLFIFHQNQSAGKTFLSSDLTPKKRALIKKDFKNNWFINELKSKQIF